MIPIKGTAGLLLIAGLLAPTWAAADQSGETATEIAPVVASATRSAQSEASTPASITVITRKQIRESGATDVAQVLRGQGGVQLSDLYGDGSRTSVSLRGFGANAAANTLILVNGERMNNIDLAAPDLNGIPLQDVERIEIIQGSAGTLFGDNAVGGVINIITRTPRRFHATVGAGLGSYGARSARAYLSDRLANGFGYLLSARHLSTDNYRRHNRLRDTNADARLDYHYRRGSVFAEFQSLNENLQFPGALFAAQAAADRRQSLPQYRNDFNATDSHTARVGLHQFLTQHWKLETELAEINSNGDGVISNTAFIQDRRRHSFTPRLIGTLPERYGDVLLTLGTDLDDTRYRFSSPFGTTQDHQKMYSAYGQAVIPVFDPRLSLTLGARNAWVENAITDSNAFPGGVTLDNSAVVAEAGLSYQISSRWRVYLRRDGNFRFPLVDEETYTSPGVVGLKPQTGVSYELGTEWHAGGNRFKVLAYRLDLNNEIDFNPAAPDPFGGNTGANVNLPPTRRTGLILQASRRLTPGLTVGGQYGYVRAVFDSGPFQGRRIPFVARNTLRLTSDYRFNARWDLFGELQAIGRRYASGDYANALQTLPGYAVLNLNLNYHLKGWRVSARVNNLTGVHYSDYAAVGYNPYPTPETAFYPSPGRNFMLTARYAFR